MLKEMLFNKAMLGGSGNDVDIEPLTVTENGEYYEGDDIAYSPVYVNVPQTTVTSLTATENKTYTSPTGTAYSPVTVNVATSVSYSFLTSKEFTVEAASSSAQSVGTISSIPLEDGKMIYIRIRNKSTVENDCFYGSDSWFYKPSGSGSPVGNAFIVYKRNSSGAITSVSSSTKSGVYVINMTGNSGGGTGTANIYKKQDSTTSGTVGGTYLAEVYSLAFPDGVYPS